MFCLWNPLRGRSCLWRSAGQRSRPQGSRWLPSCLLKLRWGPPSLKLKRQLWWSLNCLLGHSSLVLKNHAYSQLNTSMVIDLQDLRSVTPSFILSHLPLHPQVLFFLSFLPLVALTDAWKVFEDIVPNWRHCFSLSCTTRFQDTWWGRHPP